MKTRQLAFISVGGAGLVILGLLFTIVHRGSRTIDRQKSAMEAQITNLEQLLGQNQQLRSNVEAARKSATLTNERLLRRIGADLHDGPAQLMGLALLYYDALQEDDRPPHPETARFETVRGLMQDALGEIRNISADIAPPQLERLTTAQSIELAIRNHERRTGTLVEYTLCELPATTPCVRTCLYRLVQEGLNNTFRHAASKGVSVHGTFSDYQLTIEVRDAGPGFAPFSNTGTTGLGLAGLVDRVEACNGRLEIKSAPLAGTRLIASFRIADQGGVA